MAISTSVVAWSGWRGLSPRRLAALSAAALTVVGVSVLAAMHLSTANGPTDFGFAIDDGVERRLYLSGGTSDSPDAIRLLRGDAIVVESSTIALGPGIIDVCRNNPPHDARYWQANISDEIAAAIRSGNSSAYRLEGRIAGAWQPLRLRDSGCKWKGG